MKQKKLADLKNWVKNQKQEHEFTSVGIYTKELEARHLSLSNTI